MTTTNQTTTPTPDIIHAFTATNGWHRAADPRPDWNTDDDLTAAGWTRFSDFGEPDADAITLEVWAHPQQVPFVATIWAGSDGHSVLCPDVPDLLAFLGQALPVIEGAARLQDRLDRRRDEQRNHHTTLQGKCR